MGKHRIPLPRSKRRKILALARGLCQRCGDEGTEIDHVVPLLMGGDNTDGNLQLLCKECHRLKTDADLVGLSIEDYLEPKVSGPVARGPDAFEQWRRRMAAEDAREKVEEREKDIREIMGDRRESWLG